MEFIEDGLELGPNVLPFVVALCWFCSPSASIGAGDPEETSLSLVDHGIIIDQNTFD